MCSGKSSTKGGSILGSGKWKLWRWEGWVGSWVQWWMEEDNWVGSCIPSSIEISKAQLPHGVERCLEAEVLKNTICKSYEPEMESPYRWGLTQTGLWKPAGPQASDMTAVQHNRGPQGTPGTLMRAPSSADDSGGNSRSICLLSYSVLGKLKRLLSLVFITCLEGEAFHDAVLSNFYEFLSLTPGENVGTCQQGAFS